MGPWPAARVTKEASLRVMERLVLSRSMEPPMPSWSYADSLSMVKARVDPVVVVTFPVMVRERSAVPPFPGRRVPLAPSVRLPVIWPWPASSAAVALVPTEVVEATVELRVSRPWETVVVPV